MWEPSKRGRLIYQAEVKGRNSNLLVYLGKMDARQLTCQTADAPEWLLTWVLRLSQQTCAACRLCAWGHGERRGHDSERESWLCPRADRNRPVRLPAHLHTQVTVKLPFYFAKQRHRLWIHDLQTKLCSPEPHTLTCSFRWIINLVWCFSVEGTAVKNLWVTEWVRHQ